jgi:hypothetical protein
MIATNTASRTHAGDESGYTDYELREGDEAVVGNGVEPRVSG